MEYEDISMEGQDRLVEWGNAMAKKHRRSNLLWMIQSVPNELELFRTIKAIDDYYASHDAKMGLIRIRHMSILGQKVGE